MFCVPTSSGGHVPQSRLRIGSLGSFLQLALSALVVFAAQPIHASSASDPAPAAQAPATADAPLRWRLAGTLITPGARKALFARVSETRVVTEGQQIDNLTLTRVQPGVVTLSAGGVAHVLSVEGYTAEEATEAARVRTADAAVVDAAVGATIARQAAELQIANDQLLAATRQMQSR
jgi:hypothetical protein